MFKRYTEQARRAIFFARQEALIRGESAITPVHLLLGLSTDEDSLANSIANLKDKLCNQLLLTFNTPLRPCSAVQYSAKPNIPLNQDSKNVLAYAVQEADRAWKNLIDTDSLLCGLMRFPNDASRGLEAAGITLAHLRARAKSTHHQSTNRIIQEAAIVLGRRLKVFIPVLIAVIVALAAGLLISLFHP
jgi:ATP-dependent Clp protease ATP-binding subunit ClpA